MSFVTYYSPFFIGLALGIGLTVVDWMSAWHALPAGRWLMVPVALLRGVIWAVALQLALIGLQGTSAQVVPAFRGRSIRGRRATAVGLLILSGLGVSGLAILWAALSRAALTAWFWSILCTGLACLLAALITYFWCLPTADSDFVEPQERRSA